jgi:hypothetical protein
MSLAPNKNIGKGNTRNPEETDFTWLNWSGGVSSSYVFISHGLVKDHKLISASKVMFLLAGNCFASNSWLVLNCRLSTKNHNKTTENTYFLKFLITALHCGRNMFIQPLPPCGQCYYVTRWQITENLPYMNLRFSQKWLWRYWSTMSTVLEVCGQLHTPATLSSGETSLCTHCVGSWVGSLAPVNPIPQPSSRQPSPYTKWAIPAPFMA